MIISLYLNLNQNQSTEISISKELKLSGDDFKICYWLKNFQLIKIILIQYL